MVFTNNSNSLSDNKVINLKKGQRINLSKDGVNLERIMVGLGWDANEFDTGGAFDLDASAFLLGDNGKVTSENDFVFYHAPEHYSGAVKHTGDNRTGSGDGDDEQIFVDLSKVPSHISRIAFTVTIYDAARLNQNFGMVKNSYIRLLDDTTGKELLRYDLGEDYSIETAIVFAEIYRKNGSTWAFNAVGQGFQGGLGALCGHYGIDAQSE